MAADKYKIGDRKNESMNIIRATHLAGRRAGESKMAAGIARTVYGKLHRRRKETDNGHKMSYDLARSELSMFACL